MVHCYEDTELLTRNKPTTLCFPPLAAQLMNRSTNKVTRLVSKWHYKSVRCYNSMMKAGDCPVLEQWKTAFCWKFYLPGTSWFGNGCVEEEISMRISKVGVLSFNFKQLQCLWKVDYRITLCIAAWLRNVIHASSGHQAPGFAWPQSLT